MGTFLETLDYKKVAKELIELEASVWVSWNLWEEWLGCDRNINCRLDYSHHFQYLFGNTKILFVLSKPSMRNDKNHDKSTYLSKSWKEKRTMFHLLPQSQIIYEKSFTILWLFVSQWHFFNYEITRKKRRRSIKLKGSPCHQAFRCLVSKGRSRDSIGKKRLM